MKGKFDSESDAVKWQRGRLLGRGGFGSVYLAELKNPNSTNASFPELMAVKSAEISDSSSLQKEKEILNDLRSCPYIIDCYGEETTSAKNGEIIYNLLLEYASAGTLSSLINQFGGRGMPESYVRKYTRFLLQGIDYIHRNGYVHCDLKPDNVLLVSDENWSPFVLKIADFGLAKGSSNSSKKLKFDSNNIGGTSLYMAPETVIDGIQERPSDIWALGCIVYEMLTGSELWNWKPDMTDDDIFKKIKDHCCEFPKIPAHISEEAKEFLRACLARTPIFRFTAGMLLNHPFVSGISNDREIGEWSDEEEELCSTDPGSWKDRSFEYEKGYSYASPCRVDDVINIKRRRVLNDNLQLDFKKQGVMV